MTIKRIEEFEIDPATRTAIGRLLQSAFPEYPAERTYFKQLPDFRFLAWDDPGQLAGHMAVECRMVRNDEQVVRIFGVADLCVAPDFQHRRLASTLLAGLESLGRAHGVDFIVLMATDQELYSNNGFQPAGNICKWLLIQNHHSLGLVRRAVGDSLMVKAIGDKRWLPGPVDFLGHMF